MKSTIPATLALIAACGAAHAQCTPSWLPGPTGTYATSSYGTDMPVDASCAWSSQGDFTPSRAARSATSPFGTARAGSNWGAA